MTEWRTRESGHDTFFRTIDRDMYPMTAVNERCERMRTTRYVLRECCQRNESEHSSCSVGGGMSVGGNPKSGRLNERKRKNERDKEGTAFTCCSKASPLRTDVQVRDDRNLFSQQICGKAES